MDETMELAQKALDRFNSDPKYRAVAEAREKMKLDLASQREEGREEGRQEGIRLSARAMLEDGMEKSTIARILSLTLPELEEILKHR